MLAFCVLAGLVLAGCSDRRIDTHNVEGILADQYARESGVPVVAVRCPERVPTRKDHHFECTVTFASRALPGAGEPAGGDPDATTLRIDVHELGDSRLRWSPVQPVVWLTEAVSAVAEHLADKGVAAADVTCAARVYLAAGQSMMCEAPGKDGAVHHVEYALSATGEPSMRAR